MCSGTRSAKRQGRLRSRVLYEDEEGVVVGGGGEPGRAVGRSGGGKAHLLEMRARERDGGLPTETDSFCAALVVVSCVKIGAFEGQRRKSAPRSLEGACEGA
jgi:hypothetical protein